MEARTIEPGAEDAALDASPLRLRLDGRALRANWTTLARMSGRAACGAAVKADGYGLGSQEVVRHLLKVGCRDFFVTTWREAARIEHLVDGADASLSVLHGLRAEDVGTARASKARPVLNTAMQVGRWREMGGGRCDVMVDTGFNRLGVSPEEIAGGVLDGLDVHTLMSHLASADDASDLNERQRAAFAAVGDRVASVRMSLANSAGIALGEDYHFGLTRPGIALYGGVPRPELDGSVRQVAWPEAQVLQRKRVPAGASVGYNETWVAAEPTEIAILNIGYADGYPRSLSSLGAASFGSAQLPVIGRVSMDLAAVDVSGADVREGDWIGLDFRLPDASAASGRSQYELLVALGGRFSRIWRD